MNKTASEQTSDAPQRRDATTTMSTAATMSTTTATTGSAVGSGAASTATAATFNATPNKSTTNDLPQNSSIDDPAHHPYDRRNASHQDGNDQTEDEEGEASDGAVSEEEESDHDVDMRDEDDDDDHDRNSPAESSHQGSTGSSRSGQMHSSSSGSSPVHRLPSVLRPPGGHSNELMPKQQQQQPASSRHGDPRSYEGHYTMNQSRQQQSQNVYGSSSSSSMQGMYSAAPTGNATSASSLGATASRGQSHHHRHEYYGMDDRMDRYLPSRLTAAGSPSTHDSPRETSLMNVADFRGQKRRLNQPEFLSQRGPSPADPRLYEQQHHAGSNSSSSTGGGRSGSGSGGSGGSGSGSGESGSSTRPPADPEDPLRFETRGSHGPRDETRYETWTSKQLRKKCSHLKLRGLKNVKKHVMVEALYRYYRNQRQKDPPSGSSPAIKKDAVHRESTNNQVENASGALKSLSGASFKPSTAGSLSSAAATTTSSPAAWSEETYSQRYSGVNADGAYNQGSMMHRSRPSSTHSHQGVGSQSIAPRKITPSLVSSNSNHAVMRSASSSHAGVSHHMMGDEGESKLDSFDNEVRIASEDVIRLVDVILSHEFVDRLTTELSRWQFWVDVRERYISLLNSQHAGGSSSSSSFHAARGLTALGDGHHSGGNGSDLNRLPLTSYSRNTKWSSMQLWEMWKELTFAYTKTCFEFTSAGADERDYIQFCKNRPDVYYLHQRLHARPDLLHLIKSNEYIDEKNTGDGDVTMSNAEKNAAANALMDVSGPNPRPHKRFKRIMPAGNQSYGVNSNVTGGPSTSVGDTGGGGGGGSGLPHGSVNNGNSGNSGTSGSATPARASSGTTPGVVQYLNGSDNSPQGQEEGSTENSETTREDGSMEKTNSNSGSGSSGSQTREGLSEQKYFGLLLQNFEAIFESLHNKKVLLAALRKDPNAPDHLIADLHDDIHVLSALKKEFRNKLHQTLE